MRILTNDYLSNIPGSPIATKGGPPRFAADFARYISDEGHEWVGLVHVTEAQRSSVNPDSRFRLVPVMATESFEAFKELSEDQDFEALFAEGQKDIEMVIDEVKPDLVFLNGYSVANWTFFRAAEARGVPVIIQHAGIFTREADIYPDIFSPASRAACAQMEREVSERAAANVFLNESSKKALEECLPGVDISNPLIIPLPHAGWSFAKDFAPRETARRILGAVARWDRIKNHEALLALAEVIRAEKLPWTIRVVTKIPDTQLREDFKRAYRGAIEVVAPMDREALHAFYEAADVLLLPSHFDVSPTVVMEALATGRPTLIAPGVGWVSEYESCGATDWITNFNNPKEVLELLKAQFTRKEWPEMEALSRQVQLKHDPERVYAAYLKLFDSISAP